MWGDRDGEAWAPRCASLSRGTGGSSLGMTRQAHVPATLACPLPTLANPWGHAGRALNPEQLPGRPRTRGPPSAWSISVFLLEYDPRGPGPAEGKRVSGRAPDHLLGLRQACPTDDLGHKDQPMTGPLQTRGSPAPRKQKRRVMVLLNTRCPFSRRRGRSSTQSALRLTIEWAQGLGREPGPSRDSPVPSPSRWDPAQLPFRPNPSRCCGRLDLCAYPQPASLLLDLRSCAPRRAMGPGPHGCLLPHQGKTQPPPHPPPPQALLRTPHPPTAEWSSLLPGQLSKPTARTTVPPLGTSVSPARWVSLTHCSDYSPNQNSSVAPHGLD